MKLLAQPTRAHIFNIISRLEFIYNSIYLPTHTHVSSALFVYHAFTSNKTQFHLFSYFCLLGRLCNSMPPDSHVPITEPSIIVTIIMCSHKGLNRMISRHTMCSKDITWNWNVRHQNLFGVLISCGDWFPRRFLFLAW